MSKSTKKPMKKNKLEEVVTSYMAEEAKLLKKFGLKKSLIVTFPNKAKVPMLGKVGMKAVRMAGGILDTMFSEEKKK